MLRSLAAGLLWVGFFAALLIASLLISWELLAAQGFSYRTVHSILNIDQTVDQYGPLNRIRPGFQQTSLDERQRLFEAIVHGVQHGGEGLSSLDYRDGDGRSIGSLLTTAEIIHLQDVARLVAQLRPVGWVAGLLVVVGSVWLKRNRVSLPGRRLLISLVVLALTVAALLWLMGAETIFYQLHRWVFPPSHQWFFYYEESLMSMMMQAPNLFGVVAMFWALLAGLVMVAWYLVVGRKLRREGV